MDLFNINAPLPPSVVDSAAIANYLGGAGAPSEYEPCMVCGDQSDGYHYGVRSCRGCNAFFRRAITYNLHFACRRGGNCPVDKNARCACRACRLKKCEEVGMDRRAVQPKREGNGLTNERNDSYIASPVIENQLGGLTSFQGELILPEVPPSPPPNASRLVKMTFDFNEQKKRRHAIMCTTLEQVLAPEENRIRGVAGPEDLSSVFKAQIVLCFEWANKQNEWKQLERADKLRMLRSHIFDYILLDDIFNTVQLSIVDRLVLVNGAYLMPGVFYQGSDAGKYHRDTLSSMGAMWVNNVIQYCVLPWISMKVSEIEMLTVRLYAFYSCAERLLYPESKQIVKEAQNNVFKEYMEYYVDECGGRREDGSTRFKMLVDIMPRIREGVHHLYTTVKNVPDFGLLDHWERHMNERIFRM